MRNETGQGLIESIMLGLLLILPFVWLLTVLADVHRAALAATAAVREAGARAARASSAGDAARAIDVAVAETLSNHGIATGDARLAWGASRGFRRGGELEIHISYPVRVFRGPLPASQSPAVWVRARHVARIDPFRSRK